MADNEPKKTCAHQGCDCPVEGNDKFCSQVCEGAEHKHFLAISCGCGHDTCNGEIAHR